MKFRDLDIYWKRIFELNWESLCKGSKAISALLVDGSFYSKSKSMPCRNGMYSKSGYFKVSKAQGL